MSQCVFFLFDHQVVERMINSNPRPFDTNLVGRTTKGVVYSGMSAWSYDRLLRWLNFATNIREEGRPGAGRRYEASFHSALQKRFDRGFAVVHLGSFQSLSEGRAVALFAHLLEDYGGLESDQIGNYWNLVIASELGQHFRVVVVSDDPNAYDLGIRRARQQAGRSDDWLRGAYRRLLGVEIWRPGTA